MLRLYQVLIIPGQTSGMIKIFKKRKENYQMIKGRKIRGIIVAIALIICTAVSVAADSSKGWNIEHKVWNANFYGNVSFSLGKGWFKSVITYYGHISGQKGINVPYQRMPLTICSDIQVMRLEH